MATTTKKELTNSIAHKLGLRQMLVRDVVQTFLDECIAELRAGNRLEFRDFGVFETVSRAARKARNPKTGDVVQVPPKTVVDFKMGKRMRSLINQPIEPGRAPALVSPSASGPPAARPPQAPPSRPSPTPPQQDTGSDE